MFFGERRYFISDTEIRLATKKMQRDRPGK
jgi:hypothetical protein